MVRNASWEIYIDNTARLVLIDDKASHTRRTFVLRRLRVLATWDHTMADSSAKH